MKELFKATPIPIPIPKIRIKDETKNDKYKIHMGEIEEMHLIRKRLLLKWLNDLPKKNKIKFDYSIKNY